MAQGKQVTQIYTPQQIAAAKDRADQMKAEIHAAGHEEGLHKGLRMAGWYRDAALVLLGVLVGAFLGGAFVQSANENGVMTAGAVADRVLSRTVDPTPPVGPQQLTVHPPQPDPTAMRRAMQPSDRQVPIQ